MYSSSILVVAFAALASARTDLSGCVSSETVAYGGASLLWYVPGSGEICSFLDCGGGRAPPKTTVPGCPSYDGTATYSPDFIALASSTSAGVASSTTPSTAMITGSQTTAEAAPETTSESVSSASESVSESASVTSEVQTTTSPSAPALVTSTLVAAGGQGNGSSNSSTTRGGAGSKTTSTTGTGTGTAPISSATGNSAAFMSINGAVGVLAVGFALLL